MKYYDDFLDYVLPSVPSCDIEQAKFAIKNAAIELARESGWEMRTLTAIDVVSGTSEYELPFTTREKLAFISNARYNEENIYPVTETALDKLVFKWREETGSPARGYYQRTNGNIVLYPIPDENLSGGLEVEAAVKPSRDTDGVSDEFYEEFAEVVAAGALARLFRMPRRPWSDPDASRVQAALFNSGKADARIQANKSKTKVGLMVNLGRRI